MPGNVVLEIPYRRHYNLRLVYFNPTFRRQNKFILRVFLLRILVSIQEWFELTKYNCSTPNVNAKHDKSNKWKQAKDANVIFFTGCPESNKCQSRESEHNTSTNHQILRSLENIIFWQMIIKTYH